jgi:hypothetical protein
MTSRTSCQIRLLFFFLFFLALGTAPTHHIDRPVHQRRSVDSLWCKMRLNSPRLTLSGEATTGWSPCVDLPVWSVQPFLRSSDCLGSGLFDLQSDPIRPTYDAARLNESSCSATIGIDCDTSVRVSGCHTCYPDSHLSTASPQFRKFKSKECKIQHGEQSQPSNSRYPAMD